jgi:hypothetical protein
MLSESNSSIKHGNGSTVVAMKKKAVAMMEKAAAMKAADAQL